MIIDDKTVDSRTYAKPERFDVTIRPWTAAHTRSRRDSTWNASSSSDSNLARRTGISS